MVQNSVFTDAVVRNGVTENRLSQSLQLSVVLPTFSWSEPTSGISGHRLCTLSVPHSLFLIQFGLGVLVSKIHM